SALGTNFFNKSLFRHTTFQGAEFYKWVSFGSAKTTEMFDFREVKFFQGASFNSAIFSFGAHFDNAEFIHSGADFQKVKFSNETSFKEVTFSSGAFFNDAEFDKSPFNVNFSGANFARSTIFNNTKFAGNTSFRDAKFSTYATFENAIFEFFAPRFYGATFNDEMFWTDIKLPKLKCADDETEERYKKRIKGNQNAYENLSTKLGNQNKYRDEHFFFRQEMNCQQELAESFFSFCAFWLYEFFSDYGYRIGRVFGWWLGHIALGAVVIAFIASVCGDVRFHESLPCAIPISFANANPYTFLGFGGSSLEKCYGMLEPLAPTGFAIVKVIQTILGVGLLSLLIITLRTRFRLK
ncbi:MAG: hypothetical protein K8953_12725, partial [Proteobacteria bacterium]|nr:hypothetical protein [Pseudomonadota bacterium]